MTVKTGPRFFRPRPFSLILFLSLTCIFLAGCAGTNTHLPEKSPAAPTGKKGVGFWNDNRAYSRFSPAIDELGCRWYYNWTAQPDARGRELNAEFVPMIWDETQANEKVLRTVVRRGHKTLLGFNEPDVHDQADMTVDEAIALWPKLMKTGLRLGSPAPAAAPSRKNWLERFMAEADKRNYRVDFICLHWYGDITDPRAVNQLKSFLEYYWKRYGKPIWLTEFSGCDGEWLQLKHPPVTNEKNAAFIGQAIPMLESLPYVERYAWFELKWTEKPWAEVALIDPRTGRITPAGLSWRARGSR